MNSRNWSDFPAIFCVMSSEAGIALPPGIRERLLGYLPVTPTDPSSWWYALLFNACQLAVARKVAGSIVHERELVIFTPVQLSVDVIGVLRLNTDVVDLGLDVPADRSESAVKARKSRGRKPASPEEMEQDAQIAARWEQAREAGTCKFKFAKDRGMTHEDFDKLLDRVKKRDKSAKSHSEK